MPDDHENWAYSTVLVAPSPASSGTTLTVQSGDGAKFPVPPFNAPVQAAGQQGLASNSEIVRVTGIAGDVLTIVRNTGTEPDNQVRSILVGDQIFAGVTVKTLTDVEALSSSGWYPDPNTWTYSSTDGHTYVVTVNADVTGYIGLGDRIWLTNQAASQYFMVTKISFSAGTTTITMYGGTASSLTNTAITAPNYSHMKSPFGFPLDPAVWTETLTDNSLRTQGSPVVGTWYNMGSLALVIPIGVWNVIYQTQSYWTTASGTASTGDMLISLSTSASSASTPALTGRSYFTTGGVLTDAPGLVSPQTRQTAINLTAKTTYYLIAKSNVSTVNAISFAGDLNPTIISATCAYL